MINIRLKCKNLFMYINGNLNMYLYSGYGKNNKREILFYTIFILKIYLKYNKNKV